MRLNKVMRLVGSFGLILVPLSLAGCAGMMSFLAGAKDQADREGGMPTPMSALRILLNGLLQFCADNSGTLLTVGGAAAAVQHAHGGLPFTERRSRIKKEDAEYDAAMEAQKASEDSGK